MRMRLDLNYINVPGSSDCNMHSRVPGSAGLDKKDLLAQTSLNSKGHPTVIVSGAHGLRQTIK
jgi:hypothetical protein